MKPRSRTLRSRLVVATTSLTVALGTLLVATPAEAGPDKGPKRDRPVTVMTRNIYLGADIQRPLVATQGKTGFEALVALGNANDDMRDIVDQTNFPRRSELLAAEIAEARPDLIGLQEVALWRSGPVELDKVAVTNATTVDYDFLRILLQDLREEGAPYRAVQVQTEADIEGPAFTGVPGTPSFADARDVRLTMRDVILLRAGSSLRVVDKGGAHYDTALPVSIGGIAMEVARGYGWVDVVHGSQEPVRFVNTHLEAFSSDIALGQAAELVAEAAVQDRTTVIACDCNSDPLNDSVKPTDPLGTPHSGPYNFLTGSAGFTDMWLEWAPAEEGWTSGLNELVNEPAPPSFTHRIDLVLARPGTAVDVVRGEVTGNESGDKDPLTGLWPSDHAGVAITLDGLRSRDRR